MNTRYLPAKLFFALVFLSLLVGVALFRRGLPPEFYLNPLFLLFFPRLIPFGVAGLSVIFGLIYLAMERSGRPVSVPLALLQLILFLLGILGHVRVVGFWWRVPGEERAASLPVPIGSAFLFVTALAMSLLVFITNMVLSRRTALRKA